MEQWQCVRTCFFRAQLFYPGDIVQGNEKEMPRHFLSLIDGRVGTFGKIKQEPEKIDIEKIINSERPPDKGKTLYAMNKMELLVMGRSLGLNLDLEFKRSEMIDLIVAEKNKRGITNQELVNSTQG